MSFIFKLEEALCKYNVSIIEKNYNISIVNKTQYIPKNGVLEAILKAEEGLKGGRYKEPYLPKTDFGI